MKLNILFPLFSLALIGCSNSSQSTPSSDIMVIDVRQLQSGIVNPERSNIGKAKKIQFVFDENSKLNVENVDGDAILDGDMSLGKTIDLMSKIASSEQQSISTLSYGASTPASVCGPQYFFGIPVGYNFCPFQKWKAPHIWYRFAPDITEVEQKAFSVAIGKWVGSFPNKTVFWFYGPSDPDVVTINHNTDVNAAKADIGMRRGGGNMYIGANRFDTRTLLHEMLHTAGMLHEHQRCDAWLYVKENLAYPNDLLNSLGLCGGASNQPIINFNYYGPFDYNSISMYRNSYVPITPNGGNYQGDPTGGLIGLGQNSTGTTLSTGDVNALVAMYFSNPL
jgi:Astacin (Peptidase family M12A)